MIRLACGYDQSAAQLPRKTWEGDACDRQGWRAGRALPVEIGAAGEV